MLKTSVIHFVSRALRSARALSSLRWLFLHGVPHARVQRSHFCVCPRAPILQTVVLLFICICRPPAVPCCCCAPASLRSSCITTPPVHVWHSVRQRVGHPGSLTGCVLESRLLWRRIPCFPPLISGLSNLLLLPLPYTHARPLMLVLRARTLMRKGVVADYAARSEYWVVFHHRGKQQRVSAA